MKRILLLVTALLVLFSGSVFAIRHTEHTQWDFITKTYNGNTGEISDNDYINSDSLIMDKNVLYFEVKFVYSDKQLEYEKKILSGYDTFGIKRVDYTIFAYNIDNKTYHPVTDDKRFYQSDDIYSKWKSIEENEIIKAYCKKALEIYMLQNVGLYK